MFAWLAKGHHSATDPGKTRSKEEDKKSYGQVVRTAIGFHYVSNSIVCTCRLFIQTCFEILLNLIVSYTADVSEIHYIFIIFLHKL